MELFTCSPNEDRNRALLEFVRVGGHGPEHAAFVTAFWDRGRPEFRRVIGTIASNSFAWCATEPESILLQRALDGEHIRLTDLIPQTR